MAYAGSSRHICTQTVADAKGGIVLRSTPACMVVKRRGESFTRFVKMNSNRRWLNFVRM